MTFPRVPMVSMFSRAVFTRRALLTLALLVLPVSTSCYSRTAGGGQQTMILLANNRGFADVTVFVLRSTQLTGRRIGTVTGNSSATLKIPVNEIQPGGTLVLSVRTVGARFTWVSPPVQVGTGVVARLDVVQTGSGDLNQSQLYTQVVQPPE